MVSFFGLKVGGKKKKSDGKLAQETQPQQWKPTDQNKLGEGQFFGQNLSQPSLAINGSIRSVSRAATSQPGSSGRPSYVNYDTHNLAAASMIDLSTAGPGRPGSQISLHLKPHASDANIRTRFGANNGSSTSLAAPAPGFKARFGANNGSSTTSLATPGPGFGSRPGTPNRAKQWVNPLDVHFVRNVPTGPPTPKSPLVDVQLPATPTTENGETGSVFGEDADDMVDTVMSSVKKREEEAKEAAQREKEMEKQRETARLKMERLERQKSTESNIPTSPPPQPESRYHFTDEPSLQNPVFRGDAEARPGRANSPVRSPPMHQGPPPTGPPTQCLPQPPGQGPARQGPLGPSGESYNGRAARPAGPPIDGPGTGPGPGPRPNGFGPHHSRSHGPQYPGPLAHGAGPRPPGPTPQGPAPNHIRPYRLPTLQGSGPLGALSGELRSPSPPSASGIDGYRSRSPALRSQPSIERRPAVFNPEPEAAVGNGRSTPGPERQWSGPGPLISTLISPSTVASPSGSIRMMSLDDGPVEQFARPIIQNVIAKRDTLTLNTPRQHSLSMKIEELEKTLLNAQQTHQTQKLQGLGASRLSANSSVYSDGIHDDDDDDDGPILSIHPAPLRIAPPVAPPVVAAAAPINRPESPMRGPPRRGPFPRRPGLEEYGVSSAALRTRGGTPTPASRSGSTDNYSSHSSPPSRTNTPQLRHPHWRRDLSQPSPAPTIDPIERSRPSPKVDTGFNFDFGRGPGVGAPPTPDSTTWSLASPVVEMGSAPPPTSEPAQTQAENEQSAKFTRANVPPPLNLKFNFSPDAPSRDPGMGSPAGLWTPPVLSTPVGASTSGGSSVTGNKLVPSPRLISQFPESPLPGDDDRSSFMGIGMARGPSIRETRRPKTAAGGRPPMPGIVDEYGTGFI
ncbi:hypothetical protein C8A00DRAFT_12349 [Chaetomidium leptoderma]|uniref:Uncharacterized protein n=1 Tax=Chaetomidium leptoderma TaxID=669021 RepID=A0AAN6VV56_9PEZI|nr:hypothetical protein C8A00DRAFT_12349 [Chaetomidium leptoderma]